MKLQLKRIYDDPSSDDGCRVLVDRLWPRGVSKERAIVDEWLKEVAPSKELREWFDHKPERFAEFSEKYREELEQGVAFQEFKQLIKRNDKVTLLYAAKDQSINHAVVLKEFLESKLVND